MTERDDIKDGAFVMEDLVDYQKGSIVSRTLIDRDTGTLTLFAFDQGQSLSEHTAPFDAVINVLDGSAKVIIHGDEHTVERGESIIMPADIPHAVEALSRFKMLLIMIR